MPPASLSSIIPLLASPCCKGALAEPLWTCSVCGRVYEHIGAWPVLIDFRTSIAQEEAVRRSSAASPISRRKRHAWRRCLRPRNREVRANIEVLIDRLGKGAMALVVGGATLGDGMRLLYDSHVSVAALDIYGSELTQVLADAHSLPFFDGTFDAVIVQAVLEHVLDPTTVVEEIWRILKPGGLVYAETPFLQAVHEGPYDFSRFTESGHRWLFRKFHCLRSGPIGGITAQFLWSVDYLARAVLRSSRMGLIVRTLLLPLQIFDRLVEKAFVVDAAAGVYFLGIRAEGQVLSPRDMVGFYSGAQ